MKKGRISREKRLEGDPWCVETCWYVTAYTPQGNPVVKAKLTGADAESAALRLEQAWTNHYDSWT